MKGFKTVNDYVIVIHADHKKLSKGGLWIETNATTPGCPVTSVIVGCTDDNKSGLKNDDEILFYRHAAEDIYIENVKYLIIPSKAIIGIYSNEETVTVEKRDANESI